MPARAPTTRRGDRRICRLARPRRTTPLAATPGRPRHCVSSGRWMRRRASRSASTISPAWSDRKPPRVLNRPWAEIAETLKIDTARSGRAALASRDTWSGIVVHWPVDGSNERLRGRDVRPAGVRPRPPVRGLPRLRHLPRIDAAPSRDKRQRAGARSKSPARTSQRPRCCRSARAAAAAIAAARAAPALSPGEHSALRRAGARTEHRLKKPSGQARRGAGRRRIRCRAFRPQPAPLPLPPEPPSRAARNARRARHDGRPILDRLPVGILVYRLNNLIYANRAFLDWTGYAALDALAEAGGLDSLFIETKNARGRDDRQKRRQDAHHHHRQRQAEAGRRPAVQRGLEQRERAGADDQHRSRRPTTAARPRSSSLRRHRERKPRARGRPRHRDRRRGGARPRRARAVGQSQRRGAVRLRRRRFHRAVVRRSVRAGKPRAACSIISSGWRAAPPPACSNAGREAIGRVKQGGLVPLYITMGRIDDGEKFCAVLRDITAWKRTEEELINARQQAETRLHRQIRIPRQDQPRNPHAAQRHHRLLRGDDGRALRRRSATSATGNISRTSTPPAAI